MRHPDFLSRLGDRSIQLAERVSGGAMASLNLAEIKLGAQSSRCARTQVVTARMQTKLACMEAAMARHEASLARFEEHKARLEAMQ
jgi:hypothetical protein